MQTGFLTAGSGCWREALAEAPGDFYHLPGYVRLCAEQEGGEALAFLAEEEGCRLLLPLILRPVDGAGAVAADWFDVTGPYGYGGPVLQELADKAALGAWRLALSPNGEGCWESEGFLPPAKRQAPSAKRGPFLARALEAFLEGMRKRGVVAAFFRLHPFLNGALDPFTKVGRLVHHGDTVYVDLTNPCEEIWRQTRDNHRRGIHQSIRKGFVAAMDPEWEGFDGFYAGYIESMRRVGAAAFYFFPREYFLDLRRALGEHLHLCVVRRDGEVACGGVFGEVGGVVQYHLGGTRDQFLADQPSKLMLDFARFWAKERGNRIFNLGGGVGGRCDALFHFKAGFSELTRPFFTWRVVVDEAAYGALVRQWEGASGVEADAIDGFFPAYRKQASGVRRQASVGNDGRR